MDNNENIVYGGLNVYGLKLGVIMLETSFPRIKGDIGNGETFDFPVLYKIVKGGTPDKVVLNLSKEDIQPFLEAAKELEQAGVKAITTSCGFLSLFQKEMSSCVKIPVFTSALSLLPLVHTMVDGKVGILTANSEKLTDEHFKAVGVNKENYVIKGLQNKRMFTNFTVQNWGYVDTATCREELVEAAAELINEDPTVRALVLECSNMPPYTKDIRNATKLPVFDLVMLTNLVITAIG